MNTENSTKNLTKEKFKELHNNLHMTLIQGYLNQGFEPLKDALLEPINRSKDKGIQERICMCWYSFEVLVTMKINNIVKPEDKIKYNALVTVILDEIKEIVKEKY